MKNRSTLSQHFWHPVVPVMCVYHGAQPLAHFRDGVVHASPEFSLHLIQLRLQSFANRLPQHRKPSIASFLPADMREAEEIERFRSPFSALLSVLDRKWSELQ